MDSNGLPRLEEAYDSDKLKQVLDDYERTLDADGHLALLAVKGGRIVVERYNTSAGVSESSQLVSWSVAKSFVNYFVGTAIFKAVPGMSTVEEALSTPLRDTVPEWGGATDPRGEITLRDLLRMRSGLSFSEQYGVQEAGKWAMPDVVRMLFADGSGDCAGYAARQPLVTKPGENWYYSSGTSNIISRICATKLGLLADPKGNPVERSWTGFFGQLFWPSMMYLRYLHPDVVRYVNKKKRDWMQSNLFEPIGMKNTYPQFDATGNFIGSSFVFATARDFARFGLLYLRDGVWDGQRLLPEGWCEMTRQTTAVDPKEGAIFDYGLHWWIPKANHEKRGWFSANGYQGQMIVVVPSCDLVIVRLGRTEDEKGFDRVFQTVIEGIVQAFEGKD